MLKKIFLYSFFRAEKNHFRIFIKFFRNEKSIGGCDTDAEIIFNWKNESLIEAAAATTYPVSLYLIYGRKMS